MTRGWINKRVVAIVTSATVALLLPTTGMADGGQIRVDGWKVGSSTITIYTTPSPLTVGTADVSATIESSRGGSGDFSDTRIWVSAHQIGKGAIRDLGPYELSQKHATKIGFIAAEFHLPHQGAWTMTIKAQVGTAISQRDFPVSVAPESFFSAHAWLIWVIGFGIGGLLIWWAFFAQGSADDEPANAPAPERALPKHPPEVPGS